MATQPGVVDALGEGDITEGDGDGAELGDWDGDSDGVGDGDGDGAGAAARIAAADSGRGPPAAGPTNTGRIAQYATATGTAAANDQAAR